MITEKSSSKKIFTSLSCILISLITLCGCLAGCTSSGTNADTPDETETINTSTDTANDIEASLDLSGAYMIALSDSEVKADTDKVVIDGSKITITEGGVYVLSGVLTEGQIKVRAGSNEDVTLVLKSVNITNPYGNVLNVKDAQSCSVIALSDTNNVLSNFVDPKYDDEESSRKAVVSSESELTLGGKGKLSIKSNGVGIEVGGELEMLSGSVSVDAVDHGIEVVKDSSGAAGNIAISGGELTVASGNHAVHADYMLSVTGGKLNIVSSYEGIETAMLDVSGGEVLINADDDGINTTVKEVTTDNSVYSDAEAMIDISGGYVYINSYGDGFDTNGYAELSGGTLIIDGPPNSRNGAIDYDDEFTVTGGTLIVAGYSGMAKAPSSSSTQCVIQAELGAQNAESEITVKDSSSKTIVTFAPAKLYSNFVLSTPEMKVGETYTVFVDGEEITKVKTNSVVTSQGGSELL